MRRVYRGFSWMKRRPVRGDSRTGQAIWALGWMGARAEYGLDGEESSLPPGLGRAWAVARSNGPAFFSHYLGRFYWADGRVASPDTGLSKATADAGASSALGAPAFWRPTTFSERAGSVAAIEGLAATADTAANASASPAPNRSSRPGAPRSRAVLIKVARTSAGRKAGSRSSNSAATPLT